MKAFVRASVILAAVLAAAVPTGAAELASPEGKVVLQVSGGIKNTNKGDRAEFDMEQLEGLGIHKVVTTTPWFDGPIEFEGVLLADVMEKVGADGKEVEVVALNDYKATLPISDFKEFKPILATKMGGERLSVRAKGPLFVIYPYDSDPDLKNHKFYSRSVWQVYRLVVR